MASGLHFPLRKLFKVDGSKRSAHSNAYMYGGSGVEGGRGSDDDGDVWNRVSSMPRLFEVKP